MKNKSIISIIRSSEFAVWIAILSVVVQSFHSYTAFYNTSSLHGSAWGVAQAVVFSAVIDLAILFYTVRNRKDVASYAAVCMVIINAYYYYQHLGLTFSFGFGVFLSLLIPVSVYFYSEEINRDEVIHLPDMTKAEYEDKIKELRGISSHKDKQIKELDEHLDRRLDDKAELEKKIWILTKEIADLRNQPHDTSLINVKNHIKDEDNRGSIGTPLTKKEDGFTVPSTDRPLR